MAIISALISLLMRKLGSFVQALFGWSITGLFGRLPRSKQIAMSVALILSLLWPLLVVGIFLPGVAAWAVAFLPLQKWLSHTALRIVWCVLAVIAPLAVGLITRAVAPADAQKGGALRAALWGFPLAVGYALAFLITLVVVPMVKLGTMRRGWDDEHVFVQVDPGRYREVLDAVDAAVQGAGIHARETTVPGHMLAATRVLKWFARGGLDPLVADDPKRLVAPEVQLYLYPGDLLIRGDRHAISRIRAALMRRLLHAPAHLVSEPKGQHIEDEMHRLWGVVVRHHDDHEALGRMARERVKELCAELERANLPYEEWVLLYTNLHQLERAICGGPHLVDPEPLTEVGDVPHVPRPADPLHEVDNRALIERFARDLAWLARAEVALARAEVKSLLARGRVTVVLAGATVACALVSLVVLLAALVLAIPHHALAALVAGLVLIAGAAVAGYLGYRAVPRDPMAKTRARVEGEVRAVQHEVMG